MQYILTKREYDDLIKSSLNGNTYLEIKDNAKKSFIDKKCNMEKGLFCDNCIIEPLDYECLAGKNKKYSGFNNQLNIRRTYESR